MLLAAGEDVHIAAEPSEGPIGQLCRELTESVTGHALACLYAADRYHRVEREIRGHLEAGEVVISDRHIPSGLVMQRFDGDDPAFLWQLNAEAERLIQAGFDVFRVDCNQRTPERAAACIRDRLTAFFAVPGRWRLVRDSLPSRASVTPVWNRPAAGASRRQEQDFGRWSDQSTNMQL